MAAMIIHGVQPGPMLMIQHPHFIYEVVAMTTLASITILLFGLFGVRPLLQVLKVRRGILMPIVFLLCTVGAFATASRLFDVYVMLAIGIGAFFLRRRGYEMAPLVLGLVLGPLLDKSLRRGLVLSDGSLAPFFTRPIAMAFAAVTIFTILLYVPPFKAAVSRVKRAASAAACASLFGARHLKPERHEVRAVQRGAAAAAVRAAMPRWPRPWATTGWRWRRSRWPTTRCASPTRRRARFARIAAGPWPGDHRPALAAGRAGGPVHRRAPTPRCASARVGVMERLVELCAAMGGRYLVHGSPKQRSVPAGVTRAQAWDARARLPGAARPGARAGCRRHLLHRAAVPRETDLHQHGGGGGAHGATRSARRRCRP